MAWHSLWLYQAVSSWHLRAFQLSWFKDYLDIDIDIEEYKLPSTYRTEQERPTLCKLSCCWLCCTFPATHDYSATFQGGYVQYWVYSLNEGSYGSKKLRRSLGLSMNSAERGGVCVLQLLCSNGSLLLSACAVFRSQTKRRSSCQQSLYRTGPEGDLLSAQETRIKVGRVQPRLHLPIFALCGTRRHQPRCKHGLCKGRLG